MQLEQGIHHMHMVAVIILIRQPRLVPSPSLALSVGGLRIQMQGKYWGDVGIRNGVNWPLESNPVTLLESLSFRKLSS